MPMTATQTEPKPIRSTFRHDLDLPQQGLESVIALAQQIKTSPQRWATALKGRSIALLFEKPSLRTRATFELAVKQLGAESFTQIGLIAEREPLKDVARNLARWFDAIVARTFSQATVDELYVWSGVPVVNALTDLYHPCQALADIQTLKEHFGFLRGLKLAYVGDGNNVAHSLMLCAARLGIEFSIATPAGYEPQSKIVDKARELAQAPILVTNNAEEAVSGAHAVYTDVWTSMGQEAEAVERRKLFAAYQVNERLMEAAGPQAKFMHCLPAKRGEEVTDAVIESARSVVFDQAENRLHAQKALLVTLLK